MEARPCRWQKSCCVRCCIGCAERPGATPAQQSKFEVVLGPSFNHQSIEVHETKTRLKIILPKKDASRIGVTMHRVRGD